MSARGAPRLAALGWLALGAVLLAGAFPGWDRIGGKDWNYFLGQSAAEVTTIARYGQFPLWNPWRAGGQPGLGQPETMLFSPVTVLGLLFGTLAAFKLLLLPLYVIGALGLHALARELGLSGRARLVPALVFFTSSVFPMYVMAGLPNWACGLAILPWLLRASLRAERDLRQIVPGALLYAGLLLCGSVYQFIFFPVFLGLHALVRALACRSPRPLLALAALGLLGALLATPQLVPLADVWGAYPRHVAADEDALPFSALPEIWLSPDLPDLSTPKGPLVVAADGAAHWIYVGGYLGPAAAALALLGLLSWRRAAAPIVAGALCLWLAFGTEVRPSAWAALHELPVLGSMHKPQRLVMLTTFCLALLAGFGWERVETWLRRLASPRARAVLAGLLLALVGGVPLAVNRGIARHAFPIEPTPGLVHAAEFRQELRPRLPEQWGGEGYEAVLANVGNVAGMSDIPSPRAARPASDPGYRGEVYLLEGRGQVAATITPNRIDVRASLAAPDVLVVNQTAFPGWRAEGSVVGPLGERDDLLALELPAGEHELVLRYEPPGWARGLGLGAGALLVAGLWCWRRRGAPVQRAGLPECAALLGCLVLAGLLAAGLPALPDAPPPEDLRPAALRAALVVGGDLATHADLAAALRDAPTHGIVLLAPGRYAGPRLERGVTLAAQRGGGVVFESPVVVAGPAAGEHVALIGLADDPLVLRGGLRVEGGAGSVLVQAGELLAPRGAEAPLVVAGEGRVVLVECRLRASERAAAAIDLRGGTLLQLSGALARGTLAVGPGARALLGAEVELVDGLRVQEGGRVERLAAPQASVNVTLSRYMGRSAILELRGPPGAAGLLLLGTRPTVFDVAGLALPVCVDFGARHLTIPLRFPDDGRLQLRTRIPEPFTLAGGGLFGQLLVEDAPGSRRALVSPPAGRLHEWLLDPR